MAEKVQVRNFSVFVVCLSALFRYVFSIEVKGILSAIRSTVYRLILDQAADALFRGDYSDEE